MHGHLTAQIAVRSGRMHWPTRSHLPFVLQQLIPPMSVYQGYLGLVCEVDVKECDKFLLLAR